MSVHVRLLEGVSESLDMLQVDDGGSAQAAGSCCGRSSKEIPKARLQRREVGSQARTAWSRTQMDFLMDGNVRFYESHFGHVDMNTRTHLEPDLVVSSEALQHSGAHRMHRDLVQECADIVLQGFAQTSESRRTRIQITSLIYN